MVWFDIGNMQEIIIKEKRKTMKKNYRDYIYGSYSDALIANQITGDLKKERKLIVKYFKKNYLPYMPTNKNCRVLDLGCGLGNYIYAAKAFGYKNVVGVDASESVVDFCRNEGVECVLSEAKAYLEDKENLFDVIIFNDVIEHFKKDELLEVLYLLRKSLKKEGRILIKTMNQSNPVTGVSSRYMDLTHETGFTEISMRQMLLAASFKKIKIIGADIYVSPVPFVYILKFFAKINNFIWYMLNCLYGRTIVKVFEKNMIAIAYKN